MNHEILMFIAWAGLTGTSVVLLFKFLAARKMAHGLYKTAQDSVTASLRWKEEYDKATARMEDAVKGAKESHQIAGDTMKMLTEAQEMTKTLLAHIKKLEGRK